MGKVIWTKTALDQLERIVKYISEERGNSYAKIVGTRIIERTEQLENFPELGTKEPLLQRWGGTCNTTQQALISADDTPTYTAFLAASGP